MTTYSKSTLKTFFQTGDVPDGTDYANLIDSYVNQVETTLQAMAGPLSTTELNTPLVSGNNAVFSGTMRITGNFSASNIFTDKIVTSAVSANRGYFNSDLTVSGDVSASTGRIYASAASFVNGVIQGVGVVSAAGTTQATAAILINVINRGKGIVDGSTTGFAPPANRTGLTQYLFNEGPSANLWPPTGGFINGLAVNVPFPLATSAGVTIVHLTASSYMAK